MSLSNISGEGTLTGEIFGVSDVIDYNNLTNRPRINNKTVESDHNGRYYGLTESEVIDWIDYETLPEETKKNGKIYYIRNVGTYEEKTISNVAVASFNDGSPNPCKKLVVDINPDQDLHGYDKPWANGAGKNKFDNNFTTKTESGVTFTSDSEGIIHLSGNATTMIDTIIENNLVLPIGSYILNGCPSGGGVLKYRLWVRDNTTATYYNDDGNGVNFQIEEGHTYRVEIRVWTGYGEGLVFKPMIRIATEIDPTFAPYSNICPISGKSSVEVTVSDDISDPTTVETYEIALGQTVYGAKINVTTGNLSITDGHIANYNGETLPSTWISDRDEYIPNTSPTMGAEVVYKLTTPVAVLLTPTEVYILSGPNNIWANSGNIDELKYLSPTGVIENQIRTNDEIFGRA